MTTSQELKHRALAKRKQLEARLEELKADAKGKTSDAAEKIKKELAELEESVRGGWDNLNDAARERVNAWLRK